LVERGSKEYFEACAAAKYWVINNRMPEYVSPKAKQVYVQCWHGTPLKRLGYDVVVKMQAALNTTAELAGRFGLDAQKWSYLLSPSPFASEHLSSAFGLTVQQRKKLVIEQGYPRNDAIVATLAAPTSFEAIRAIKEHLGIPATKKVLLYAPTWRDDNYKSGVGYTQNLFLDMQAMQDVLCDDWVILVRAHYYIANQLDLGCWSGFVYDVSRVKDINDLYCVADALLTDYSSVLFDYANTARPVLYFWPDREHYEQDIRGFYFDPATLPGPKCQTTQEVITALETIDAWHDTYGKDYEAFKAEFCCKDDGHAAKRVIEQVFLDRPSVEALTS
jgi:CDP-glycerol glycerophosphotransferase